MVTISPSIVVFAAALIIGLYFTYYIRSIIAIIFLAFIIVVAINPGVNWLQRRARLPRVLAGLLMYLLLTIVIAGLIAVIVPPLVNELGRLVAIINFPLLQEEIKNFSFTISEIDSIAERVNDSFGVIAGIVSSTFSGLFAFVTLIVISFYMMLDRPVLHKKISWFTKEPKHIQMAKDFLDTLELQLGGWVRGQAVLMFVIGLVTYIGLTLLGVPYALPLALIAGLLEIVPNIGPTISAIPAIVLAYLYLGPVMAGATTIFYVLVQQLENHILVPRVLKDNADVNPLVAIVVILIGLKLAGVVGALLAVPAYIVLRTIYGQWFDRRWIKEEAESISK